MECEVGTVITESHSPTPEEFQFVVTTHESDLVGKGQFVQVDMGEKGLLVARIITLHKTNRYFSRADSVRQYERGGHPVDTLLPTTDWEFMIARAKPMGLLTVTGVARTKLPVSPGQRVETISPSVLSRFLGLDPVNGLNLGEITEGVEARVSLTRLLQKHLAILAISGGGKSYVTWVLIEELLSRTREQGRPAIIVFDVHGEYKKFADTPKSGHDFSEQVDVINGNFVQFATPLISARMISCFERDISPVQIRELTRNIIELRKQSRETMSPYSMDDLAESIANDPFIPTRSRDALLGWLFSLQETSLFGAQEYPDIEAVLKPGKLTVIDLSGYTSLRIKQMIVTYLSQRVFNLRKANRIPPTVIVLEEAHQFCPEARQNVAISKSIIETIAREGRKFYTSLVLISQRPVRLSTTVLSQCNSQLVMRMVNPYDLDYIGRSSEGIDAEGLKAITTLGVGEGLLIGNAVNVPTFTKIRVKLSEPTDETLDLEAFMRLHSELERFEAQAALPSDKTESTD